MSWMDNMPLNELIAETPFSYRSTKNGLVQIAYKGRVVTTLSGAEAAKFFSRIASGDSDAAQLIMAKATGHFKHGNERMSKTGK